VASVETQAQPVHFKGDFILVVMAEEVQETVKMVLQRLELDQAEYLEMAAMELEPIFYLELGAEVDVH
jgi:hypothetical protein